MENRHPIDVVVCRPPRRVRRFYPRKVRGSVETGLHLTVEIHNENVTVTIGEAQREVLPSGVTIISITKSRRVEVGTAAANALLDDP